MSKQAKRRQHRPSARGPAARPTFTPVPVRARHDGWSATRQIAFLQVLSQTACVEEAARAVGMSPRSAYTLKARPDAGSFRQAWDLALDFAVGRLGDALVGRAVHGEVTPVFYRGEQVGERRRFDNRLAMWLLRHRQPERYGRWTESLQSSRGHPDGAAWLMGQAIAQVADDAQADEQGRERTPRPPLRGSVMADDPMILAAEADAQARRQQAQEEADLARFYDTVGQQVGPWRDGAPRRDAVRTS